MIRFLTLVLFGLWIAEPAYAHSLRVFATVEGSEVKGYGFFVGGGRPQDVEWKAVMSGDDVAHGRTDDQGGFHFATPEKITGPLSITLNSGEGHIATRVLSADRFGAAPAKELKNSTPAPAKAQAGMNASGVTEQMIETAVAREIAPLLERIEQMDARLRFTDIISGICLIIGIAGIALWARGKHR